MSFCFTIFHLMSPENLELMVNTLGEMTHFIFIQLFRNSLFVNIYLSST